MGQGPQGHSKELGLDSMVFVGSLERHGGFK